MIKQLKSQTGARSVELSKGGLSEGPFQGLVASSGLRSSLIRIAAGLPQGDPTRRDILAAVKEAGPA